jgi:glucosyl-3-phosphoglycerate synthase
VGRVLETPGRPVFLVRARHTLDLAAYQRAHGGSTPQSAITAEQWFVENTYHADEFKKLESWQHLKQAHHARVSVVLPTLNDGSRLIRLLSGLRIALMEHAALADEIVVVDAGSTDDTPALVRAAGFPLLALPERDPLQPSGPAAMLAGALPELVGDLVVWIDPKAAHLDARLVLVLTAPLLADPAVQLVKPFSATPESDDPAADPAPPGARFSRITPADLLSLTSGELAALPLHAWFRAFFPLLGALVEPTGRIFAARRAWLLEILEAVTALPALSVAESVVFNAALVLETAARQGVRAIAQVEFEQRKSRRTRTANAGAELRQLRQVSALLSLFATRPDAAPHALILQQLQAHLASLGEL